MITIKSKCNYNNFITSAMLQFSSSTIKSCIIIVAILCLEDFRDKYVQHCVVHTNNDCALCMCKVKDEGKSLRSCFGDCYSLVQNSTIFL